MKNKGGRPKAITKEIGEKICQLIAKGYSLRQVVKKLDYDEGIKISRDAILERSVSLAEDDKWFVDHYAKAIQTRAFGFADEIMDIADDGSNDWYEAESDSGDTLIMKPDKEHINRSRLRIDSRKWVVSKMLPKIYGDKTTMEHTGANGTPLIPVINVGTKPKE